MRASSYVWLAIAVPGAALAQVCPGGVTALGSCDAGTATWCYAGSVVQQSCAHCGLVDCTDAGFCTGYGCVGDVTARCGDAIGTACDVSLGLACVGGECLASSPCDAGYLRSCSGSTLSYCNTGGLVAEVDCAQGGTAPYTCGVLTSGQASCVGLPGGACNDPGSPECVPRVHARLR